MPQVLKEEVRNSILNSAIKIFKQNDYSKSSMNHIAENAGISVGNIYRYFKNKEELFDVIVRDLAEKVMSIMDKCKNVETIDEVFDVLKEAIDEFVTLYESNEDIFVILIQATDHLKKKYDVENSMVQYLSLNLNNIARNFCQHKDINEEDLINLCTTLSVSLTKGVNFIMLSDGSTTVMKKRLYNYLDFMRVGFIENIKIH
ncbi:MAG: TetR/AcrR family transcriptional regulator [Tissierellales bacterium]|nr:TetR/AcrR family transcriptional regulator [Tissierellales bacterium]MBN2826496.1 TetR/AcrR family transcriptional regulator [Tissierellales bacterium]